MIECNPVDNVTDDLAHFLIIFIQLKVIQPFHENDDVMDSSTKLYSIVNITVNDVADRRNKSNNFFQIKTLQEQAQMCY